MHSVARSPAWTMVVSPPSLDISSADMSCRRSASSSIASSASPARLWVWPSPTVDMMQSQAETTIER